MGSLLKYPLFNNPEGYLRFRRGSFISGFLKRKLEHRALDKCLAGLDDVRIICDAPSGPGRLFHYWQEKGFRVHAVDLSEPMVAAAREEHHRLGLSGTILHGDIFRLKAFLKETVDIVICIRFIYYFDREARIELLRALSAVTRRYLLVQYRTTQTFKGWLALQRRGRRDRPSYKHFCSYHQIAHEMQQGGLMCIRIVPMSQFSERILALAGKDHSNIRLSNP